MKPQNLLFAVVILAVTACSKSTPVFEKDAEKPQVNFINPSMQSNSYNVGEKICIKATVADKSSLQKVTAKLTQNGNTIMPTVISVTEGLGNNYYFDKIIYPPTNLRTNIAVVFEALDIYGNKSVTTFPITIQ
jgi:hypothetical protein